LIRGRGKSYIREASPLFNAPPLKGGGGRALGEGLLALLNASLA